MHASVSRAVSSAGGVRGALELFSTVTLGVVGYGVYLGLPVILGALARAMHLDDGHIGWLASFELAGLTIGSLVIAKCLPFVAARRLATVAIVLALVLNGVSAFVADFAVLCGLRMLAGFAGGACYSLSLAGLAWFGDMNRNSSVLGTGFVLVGSAEIAAVPWLDQRYGVHAVFLLLVCMYAVTGLLLRFFPREAKASDAESHAAPASLRSSNVIGGIGLACLLAIAIFNASATMFWTYVERLGGTIGLSSAFVAGTLNVSNLATLASTWLALLLARRFGLHLTQIVGLGITAAVVATWSLSAPPADFAVRVFLWFQILAICIVHQISMLGTLDRSGRLAALLPAAQGVGQSIGPLAGGFLFTIGLGFREQLAAEAVLLVATALIFASVFWRARRPNP